MLKWQVEPTERWSSPLFDGKPMPLVLAPGTVSGYKRVTKINDDTFQARRRVNGKLRHVWTSDDPCECAYVLARLEQEPCSEESIKRACRENAKERADVFELVRKQAALSRRIRAMHEAYVEAPKRAREAAKLAVAEAKAARYREADIRYANK